MFVGGRTRLAVEVAMPKMGCSRKEYRSKLPEGRRGGNDEESRLFWWAWLGVLVGLGDWRTDQTGKRLKIALRGKTRRPAANPLLSPAAGKVQTKNPER